jgi:hypothetical protein
VSVEDNPDRVEQFAREIAAMNIRTPQAEQERWALVGGILCMVVGLACIIGGWWGASGTTVIVDAISYLISGGVLGLGLIIIGAALFVRYSSTRYMRYWLVRMIYEEQANADRVQHAIEHMRVVKKASGNAAGGDSSGATTITPTTPAG